MIEKYYFLFALAGLYIVFATIQDLKKEEIANWLNFSLIGFAFAYRAFYFAYSFDWMFLIYGLIGFALCFVLGNAFYYLGAFGGGDAKLLMGLGLILPIESYSDVYFIGLGFVFLLFLIGACYSLIYSAYLVVREKDKFKKEFGKYWMGKKILVGISLIFGLACGFVLWKGYGICIGLLACLFFIFVPLIYFYLLALEKCMIRLVMPENLMEGDWIMRDIKLRSGIIKKTIHGLSLEDIKRLRKEKKAVLIKKGIPFTPAFLIAFVMMVFFSEALLFQLEKVLLLLS